MSKSRPRPRKEELSGESDLDSTITPINAATDNSQGRIIESDSLSDFYLHEISGKHRRRKQNHHKRREPSDLEEEGFQNISNENIRDIYKELQVISEKLKAENKSLHEREQKLKERERMVSISSQNIQTIAQHEIKQKLQVVEEKYKADIFRLETLLREKNKENKRLKDNFETLKQANDALKKEFESLQSQHEKLEKQAVTVQARLTNLQRKQEFDQRQKEMEISMGNVVPKQQKPKEAEEKTKQRVQKTAGCCFDVTGILLDWVSDAHLRCAVSENPGKPLERFLSPEYLQDKVMKILPSAVDMLREFPGQNLKISLPCIQFIYWALIHVENCAGQQGTGVKTDFLRRFIMGIVDIFSPFGSHLEYLAQFFSVIIRKSGLSSTLRRLGEELYRAKTVRFSELERSPSEIVPSSPSKIDKSKDGIYFRSQNLHVRLLSSLIILKTLSQVDLLAHVFDVLRNDLKSDIAKELFLYYQATPVVLQYLKPVNKTFMGSAMDIFLQMSTDSPFQQPFLETCSTETWFRTIAMVLRAPSQDSKLLEKLSIILQKLSKFRCNRKYFEVYTIVGIIQELLRGCPTDQAFLALNLKSILFNLTSGAAQ